MRCFNCSAEISDGSAVCPQCNAYQGFTQELIDRAKNNDQHAITELYNKTYSNVYYTVKALIKDEDTALDILQDSYIKAFKNLSQLESADKFRAWVKRIAHNRAIDYLRQTKPMLFSEMESEDSDTPLDFEDTRTDNLPEEVIDREETARLLKEILSDIPEEQRAVISMFYYEQLSVKEIAEELSVSENTVKSRLNYGRKKIEAKVLDLEKKGTKLYGLAPVPFLLLLFKSQSAHSAPVATSVSANILSSCTGTAATASTATAASTGIIGAIKASVAAKIIAGVITIAVVGGSATGIVYAVNKANENTAVVAEVQTEAPTEMPTVIQTESPTKAPTEPPTEAPTEVPDTLYGFSGVYTDPRGIFRLTLPEVWSDYGMVQTSERDSRYYISLRYARAYDEKGIGNVLSFVVDYDTNAEPMIFGGGDILVRTSDYTVYWYTPTDVQYDIGLNTQSDEFAQVRSEYESLRDTVSEIVNSFELIN